MEAIKVLIIDDSELIRSLLSKILAFDPAFEVVGTAIDPFDAREKIKLLAPDILTLDVEMPRMDGITFLKNLMRLRPMPVVMISTLTEKGANTTLQALELGAVDYIAKPKMAVETELPALANEICAKLKQAVKVNVSALEHNIRQEQFVEPIDYKKLGKLNNSIKLIAIGASTGGTEAIKEVLCGMPPTMPPIVVVQHMPENFTGSYARRLDGVMQLNVEEFLTDGQVLESGHAYIAHGGFHMQVRELGGIIKGLVDKGDSVNRHKPSVDVLFNSVASMGANTVGIILTGMGIDGAAGLGNMRKAGALTVAQDEQSSVVWGMPRVAIQEGAAQEVLPLSAIGRFVVSKCYSK